jgi:hypothetical protein
MVITSSGVICDVCGKYILLEDYNTFTLKGLDNKFQCHAQGDCKDTLMSAKSYKQLPPESPIRKAFEKLEVKI